MKPILRLNILLRPYWSRVFLSLLCILALTAISLTVPAIIRQVIDVGLAQHNLQSLVQAALFILGMGLARAVISYSQRYLLEWIAHHVGYDLRNRLYNHIQHLSFTYHDHAQAGQLISRVIEDVRAIERFTGGGVVELVRMSVLLVAVLILLFTQQPGLAAISLLPILPLLWLTTRYGRRIGGYFLAVDNALGDLSTRLQENVSGVQVVRAFAREPYEIDRFERSNRELYNRQLHVTYQWSKIMPSGQLLVTLSTILVLWFGGQMVIDGRLTIGELVAFNSYLLLFAQPVQQLTWLVNQAGEASAGAQRTFEILDIQPEIHSAPDSMHISALAGRVEFQDVSFNYQGETAHALSNINLVVEPNQVIALIGPTGSGKTSLVNLIPRFYDANQGVVRVDGIDIRQVELTSLRQQIGIVLQTSLLFSATIHENIAYGRPDASRDEVIQAAQAAQADEFISQLPNGYDTVVGERGVTLSGGQRQRVAIARALLMNPRILILDDSTSSVDTETERLIQKALDKLMEGRTTFVIAHRLSTIRRADLILVMQAGKIIERGKHAELLKLNGLYREIYDLQLRDQEQLREDMESLATAGTPALEKAMENTDV